MVSDMDWKSEEAGVVEAQSLDSRWTCRLAIVLKWLLVKLIGVLFPLHLRKRVSSFILTKIVQQESVPWQ